MKGLKPHKFAELLPMMSEPEYQALKADVIANKGFNDRATLFQGQLLDGRNRNRVSQETGIPLPTVTFKGTEADALRFVYSKAVHRNMTDSQKAAAAVNFLPKFEQIAKHHKIENLKGASQERTSALPGKSATNAGGLFGVSTRYVELAKQLHNADSKLFQKVFEGDSDWPLTKAIREIHRRKKAASLRVKHRQQDLRPDSGERWSVFEGDCIAGMRAMKANKARPRLIFADSPYNIGIDYGLGTKRDSMADGAFVAWCQDWITAAADILADDGSMFVMMSGKFQADLWHLMHYVAKLHWRSTIAWGETFGNYTPHNFTACHRHIHYFTKSEDEFVWHGDEILIASDRQAKYGDKRANPKGKVPGDVWTEFPRLVDNAKERMPGFPTQLPLALLDRIIRVASDPGDIVLDPFNGTGTTGEAALRNRRRYGGFDVVPANVEFTRRRLSAVQKEMESK